MSEVEEVQPPPASSDDERAETKRRRERGHVSQSLTGRPPPQRDSACVGRSDLSHWGRPALHFLSARAHVLPPSLTARVPLKVWSFYTRRFMETKKAEQIPQMPFFLLLLFLFCGEFLPDDTFVSLSLKRRQTSCCRETWALITLITLTDKLTSPKLKDETCKTSRNVNITTVQPVFLLSYIQFTLFKCHTFDFWCLTADAQTVNRQPNGEKISSIEGKTCLTIRIYGNLFVTGD